MKQASECLELALRCQVLSDRSSDAGTRVLRELAAQWRKLADNAERHRRIVALISPDNDTPDRGGGTEQAASDRRYLEGPRVGVQKG
jgi:hypothetical protein